VDRFYRHKSRLTLGILNIEIADERLNVGTPSGSLVGACTVVGRPPSLPPSGMLPDN
jgi:hypothetical protein